VSKSAELLAASPGLADLYAQILRVAAAPRTTALIQGESGSGKELVARAIHDLSPRRDRRFVALNCAALNEGLLESELFGYEAGAFTGGSPHGREGLFHAAEGGTLLFDEIGEMAPGLQAKLLRALQERVYRRVGAREERPFDVRIVAATHRDLDREVAAGRFREDLFYRLNVISLTVPALRRRPKDVLPIAQRCLARIGEEIGRDLRGFTPEAARALEKHAWPGNVRELENVVQRAALMSSGDRIGAADLALGSPRSTEAADALPLGDRSLRAVEQSLIRRVLEETDGNRSRAALVLGINRTTLYAKMRVHGIAG
jgi:transcriptional regulator with PAS, ATPase and Fis domain